ncbi:MAG: hypothetical protein SGARI_006602 [Bacillariaceae sp.]
MFVVETIRDTVKVDASDLGTGDNTSSIIYREIDKKYPNRVIYNVGLVIARYHKSKLRMQHGKLQGSCTHWPVTFDLIVFRPCIGEIIVGHVYESTEEGLQVSVGFFDAIFIPAYWMLNPSKYENDGWVWAPKYDDDEEDEDDDGPTTYEMNTGAEIRVRVKAINYNRNLAEAKGKSTRARSGSVVEENFVKASTMQVVASICEDGLGLTEWWKEGGDEEEDEEEEEEEANEEV